MLTEKEKEESSSSSPKQIMHSINTLEHALIFLFKGMINEHVFTNLMSITRQIFQPSIILRFDKIMRVLGISATHNKWDKQCNDGMVT